MNLLRGANLQHFTSSNSSANIVSNMSVDGASVAFLNGNKNEATLLAVWNQHDEFIEDTPYVLEFPAAPKLMSCFYISEHPGPDYIYFKSIKAQLEDKKVTIKTYDRAQQAYVLCIARFSEEIDEKEGQFIFGSDSSSFVVGIGNNPLVLNAIAKTNNGTLTIAGVATDALSTTTTLEAALGNSSLYVKPGTTCNLDIEGRKSKISIALRKDSDLNAILSFDLSQSPIGTGKYFSIKCDDKEFDIRPEIKGLEYLRLDGNSNSDAFTFIHVNYAPTLGNSAAFVGVSVAIVATVASVMSLFF